MRRASTGGDTNTPPITPKNELRGNQKCEWLVAAGIPKGGYLDSLMYACVVRVSMRVSVKNPHQALFGGKRNILAGSIYRARRPICLYRWPQIIATDETFFGFFRLYR